MGGKFNGEKIGEVRKDFVGPKSHRSTLKEQPQKSEPITEEQRQQMVRANNIVKNIAFPGGIPTGELKQKIRGGELDHLYPQVQAELDRISNEQKEADAAKRKEKSDAWKEKNLPKLQQQAAARREREAAEQKKRVDAANAYKTAAATPVSERTYLDVPYSRKDEAKAAGAFWDEDRRKWFAVEMNDNLKSFAPKNTTPTATPPAVPAPTTKPRTPPTSGRIDENSPSLWGHELLGYEGDTWQSFYQSEAGQRFQKKYRMTAQDEIVVEDVPDMPEPDFGGMAMDEFREQDHPRDKDGKFTSSSSQGVNGKTQIAKGSQKSERLSYAESKGFNTETVFVHAGNSADLEEIKASGNFPGLFSLPEEESSAAESYGKEKYSFVIKGEPWGDSDIKSAIGDDWEKAEEIIRSLTSEDASDETVEHLIDVVSGRTMEPTDEAMEAVRAIDDADWYKEAQSLRMKFAAKMGASAVIMDDEFGDSTVALLPGDGVMMVDHR